MSERLKGWKLLDILDSASSHCEYCGAKIRWGFLIRHDGEEKIVGSECVRSHLDDADPAIALMFLRANWRQRRQYFWKRVAGLTWVVGPKKQGGWYLAATQSVCLFPWVFQAKEFESPEDAQRHLALRLFKTSWLGTKLREVVQCQGEVMNA